MKKILYILAIVVSTSLVLTSCTEESVKPKTGTENGGGSDPIIKG